MSTAIQWTDETWNPALGCRKVSEGCRHCYAKDLHDKRHKAIQQGAKLPMQYQEPFETPQLMHSRLHDPLKWQKPQRIFVNSMGDLFYEDIPDTFIDKVFMVMWAANRHDFQVLTKRPERMKAYTEKLYANFNTRMLAAIRSHIQDSPKTGNKKYFGMLERMGAWLEQYMTSHINGLENVWLGVSVEDMRVIDRVDILRQTPAQVRFLSCEPLLGALELDLTDIHWVITGGESGHKARFCNPDWVRGIRDQCVREGVAYFHKQWGGRTPKAGGRLLDGRTWDEFPRARQNEEVAA